MIRALLAEDDPLLLDIVATIFEHLGYEVTCASSGGAFLDCIAEQEPFDIIVTDVAMPWMSGLQVMHSARAAGLPSPTVVMTALRDPRILDQVESLGDRTVLLLKPFSLRQLYRAVAEVLTPVIPQPAAALP